MQANSYHLKVGHEARDRLDMVHEGYGPSSKAFLNSIGLKEGMSVATFGCGTGNMEIWISKMVGSKGSVLATDMSFDQLSIAQSKAQAHACTNIKFLPLNVMNEHLPSGYDLIYSRFLLMHVTDPKKSLKNMLAALKPKGIMALEEVVHTTAFSIPENEAFKKAILLMDQLAQKTNLDFDIGKSIISLLKNEGISSINSSIYQPIFTNNNAKALLLSSLREAANKLINFAIIDSASLNTLLKKLEQFTYDNNTTIGLAKTFQVTGVKN